MPIDIDAIVNAAIIGQFEHSSTITYYPVVSAPEAAPFPVRGIWDREHEAVLTEVAGSETKSSGVSTTLPVLNVRLAPFARPPQQGDRFEVDGEIFKVSDVRPDGLGMADLVGKLWDDADADF